MPEAPDILFNVFFLNQILNNCIVKKIIHNDNNITFPDDFVGNILNINSNGKLFWLFVKGNNKNYYIHIHFGLTGWIYLKSTDNTRYVINLVDENNKNINLYIDDKINLSSIKILNENEHSQTINKLGVDIFSSNFTSELFLQKIKSKNTLLASFLLNQHIFSGIGNYIKNEVLYLSKLNVKIKTNQLTNNQINILYHSILFVSYSVLMSLLKSSNINTDITNNYFDKFINKPINLNVPYEYVIYKKKITSDGIKVNKIKIAGRDTYCTDEYC
jgi:formamidopyrimidine-DNA glycosylase